MGLFENLPPPLNKDRGETSSRANEGEPGSEPSKKTLPAPIFKPNLRRRTKAPLPPTKSLHNVFGTESDVSSDDERRIGLKGVGRHAEKEIPKLNPLHPHSHPQDPQALMNKWATSSGGSKVVLEAGEPEKKRGLGLGGDSGLAEYMPAVKETKIVNERDFSPREKYNPACPNNYQVYKRWVERERILKEQRKEWTTAIVLTNMANSVDETLIEETVQECSAFGKVVGCTIKVDDEMDKSDFGRIKVVVVFEDKECAAKARSGLDDRLFDGRHISAAFCSP